MITISKDEQENRLGKSKAHAIANEIFEYADERVGHAEGVPKEELILACYERLGDLMGQWARKLDKLERVSEEPTWLRKFVQKKESVHKRPLISYDSTSLGFRVENLFFAKEGKGPQDQARLTDDGILISEPSSMLAEDFRHLITFCEENGLEFYVDGFGSKEPGRTFRVAVYAPKLTVRSQIELREKILLALKTFSELSNMPTGKQVVRRSALIAELKKTGQFDEPLATEIVEVIIAGKLIPQNLIN